MTNQQKQLLSEKNAELEKKLAAKTRELEIQTSLEKVRETTMAMQRSEDLKNANLVVLQQMQDRGITSPACFIVIMNEANASLEFTVANSKTQTISLFKGKINDNSVNQKMYDNWKSKSKSFVIDMQGKELANYRMYLKQLGVQMHSNGPAEQRAFSMANFSKGIMGVVSNDPLSTETTHVLERFAKVFDGTYTRFLDLQKAEAQTREAQIELGLERVRARAMSMQKSDELKELIGIVFTELTKLDLVLTRCVIMIYDINTLGITWWMANSEDPSNPAGLFVKHHQLPPHLAYIKAWRERDLKWHYVLEGKIKKEWDDFLFVETELSHLPDFVIAGMKAPDRVYLNASFNSFGNLTLATLEPLSDEHADILLRFAKVFDLTYTRFNDLKQAEAQAREAQIEVALEKVRSQSLAMHHSNELEQVAGSLFDRLVELGLSFDGALIFLFEKEKRNIQLWVATVHLSAPAKIELPYDKEMENNVLIKDLWHAIETGEHILNRTYSGEGKNDYFRYTGRNNKRKIPKAIRKIHQEKDWTVCLVAEKNSIIGFDSWSGHATSDKDFQILIRFARVFEQAYIRFLDLQKAEAQAREGQIEAALERVRGKAMSMHSSRDLADTIEGFYHEMELLSVTPRRCGVGLMDKETHAVELSTMNTTEEGESIEVIGKLNLAGHPVLEGIYDNWILQKEYHPVLRGNEIKKYYQLIRPQIAYPDYPTDTAQYGYFFFFNEGGVYAWTDIELSEDELKIYRKFTSVLSLTYKRYKDLKQAELNTREAIKRASLDRVRAETASMRTSEDLEKITPLIWNELTTLNVPFIRCGVFIMDEQQEQIRSFLSTPNGKAIAAFQLPYDSVGELSKVLVHWHKKEIYKDHWDEAAFAEWTKSLVEHGAITSEEKYSTSHRPVNLHLHFLPFLQGMLYVGSEAPLNDDEIHLVQSLADAFSTAYARYEDFNKLESAKAQIEKTLVDLKQAQAQLVQSEKMASLGELTAGIAHEIQNPLNFVNNFSDVNAELLLEMRDEIEKGNNDEAKAIANDVIENEQKINHHGKRADAIVKGMLQHSRKSSGQKELTDINALADEYLRLSYHGLRAKDKTFNATMKTDFDENIGKINVIPQDISRVLLNLFNNAFYAVNEQKTRNPESYKPTVSVSTKKHDKQIQIIVKDNGNGIPENIVDKIFQPFFTTKPTGQGTGLGLSLAYDIVKAHGGELKVEAKANVGTEFIIQLPTT
jgi:signal transduction histidine kinase